MLKNDHESTYEVGYGQPPKRTRFRQGASGNPRGRPKGKRNWTTILERTLQEKTIITENGVPKTVTKLEAAFKQLVNKAASGDLVAVRHLSTIVSATGLAATDSREKKNVSTLNSSS